MKWLTIVAMLALCGCGPSATTGHLALVTMSNLDSTVLLKSGHTYHDLGPVSGTICGAVPSKGEWIADNFAKVVETAMNSKGNGDKLIALTDVTTSTHRGYYFPIWMLIPLPPFGALPLEFPTPVCTSVSGTAIEFLVSQDCAPWTVHREGRPTWLRSGPSHEDDEGLANVTSLQPTLEWERTPPCWRDVAYDLIVWLGKPGGRNGDAQFIVYERQDLLNDPVHFVEKSMEPGTHYYWAVRAHFKLNGEAQVSPWTYEIGAGASDEPHYYHFMTPGRPSVSQ